MARYCEGGQHWLTQEHECDREDHAVKSVNIPKSVPVKRAAKKVAPLAKK